MERSQNFFLPPTKVIPWKEKKFIFSRINKISENRDNKFKILALDQNWLGFGSVTVKNVFALIVVETQVGLIRSFIYFISRSYAVTWILMLLSCLNNSIFTGMFQLNSSLIITMCFMVTHVKCFQIYFLFIGKNIYTFFWSKFQTV